MRKPLYHDLEIPSSSLARLFSFSVTVLLYYGFLRRKLSISYGDEINSVCSSIIKVSRKLRRKSQQIHKLININSRALSKLYVKSFSKISLERRFGQLYLYSKKRFVLNTDLFTVRYILTHNACLHYTDSNWRNKEYNAYRRQGIHWTIVVHSNLWHGTNRRTNKEDPAILW